MNPQFQSSFIPKKPLVAPSPSSRKTSAINLFLLLGVIVFLGSAVTAGVFYFWDKSLQAQIDTNNEQINKFISNFGTSAEKFISTGKRIELAKQILNNHYAVSNAFTILEDLTAKNVRFNSFTYSLSGADEVSIQLKGEARTRNTVAFQSDLFRGDTENVESLVKNPIFSDVRVDEKTGLITFSVDAKLDKADLLYRNRFEAK